MSTTFVKAKQEEKFIQQTVTKPDQTNPTPRAGTDSVHQEAAQQTGKSSPAYHLADRSFPLQQG